MPDPLPHVTNPATLYERSDVSPALVAKLGLGLAGFAIGSVLLLVLVFPGTLRQHRPDPTILRPEPRLQADEAGDLRRYRAVVEAELSRYGWVDRGRGIVHVPISEAIERAARDGLPGWPGGAR